MPACASENFSRSVWSSSPPTSRSNSASPPLPSSPLSTSPPQVSPISTLKRSTSNVSSCSNASSFSSAPTVIFNHKRQHHQRLQRYVSQQQLDQQLLEQPRSIFLPSRFLNWYLDLIIGFFHGAYSTVNYILIAPALWGLAWLCMFWVILQLPLTILKWFITILHTPASERARNKRCVLISGGSTVQAVRLAQNFYKAGARVVVCDLEGLFALARFSTACSKYYTVPRPKQGSAAEYVKALKDIIQKERAVYYIPVSATNNAYYDALAKPHLESLGCECFVPNAAEMTALDDPLELLRRCCSLGLPTPTHFILRSFEDVNRLYERETLRSGRFIMLPAGPIGMTNRSKISLPATAAEFRRQGHEINDLRPWVVIRDPGGSHYITCSTIKDSKVVTNVSCRVDKARGLIPEERLDINLWLEKFFSRNFGSRISGHMSFRIVVFENGDLVAIGCRVGIGLPYVCHTSIHPRLVWRPCRHFSRQNSSVSGNIDASPKAINNALKISAGETNRSLLGTVLDKKEALFIYWDPLPYCAYYYLQLPFGRVARAIRDQPAKHNPPLAVVQ